MSKPVVCIIGTGLIGGSLALALKQADFAGEIVGAGRSEATLKTALALGVVDRYQASLEKAVTTADIVVIAVPLGAMHAVFKAINLHLKPGAIVTDAGSAKQSVIMAAARSLAGHFNNFVPGHPIAGTERSGVSAAFADLYQKHRVILTPTDKTSLVAVEAVTAMWRAAGAEVECMNAEHHDLVLAGTSHLPHLLAFGLVDCLNQFEEVDEIFRFAAGGFRDFTRIASSDPVMWRDICLNNKTAVLEMMRRYRDQMDSMYQSLEAGDGEALKEIFERAKKARDDFCG